MTVGIFQIMMVSINWLVMPVISVMAFIPTTRPATVPVRDPAETLRIALRASRGLDTANLRDVYYVDAADQPYLDALADGTKAIVRAVEAIRERFGDDFANTFARAPDELKVSEKRMDSRLQSAETLIDGDTASIKLSGPPIDPKVAAAGGDFPTLTVHARRENGTWRIRLADVTPIPPPGEGFTGAGFAIGIMRSMQTEMTRIADEVSGGKFKTVSDFVADQTVRSRQRAEELKKPLFQADAVPTTRSGNPWLEGWEGTTKDDLIPTTQPSK